MEIEIKRVPINSKIEILGHTIHGLQEIRMAVEVESCIHFVARDHEISRVRAKKPIKGLHVVELYERYPCFDASDYAYEKRCYSNYFFSTEPLSDEAIVGLSKLKRGANYCMITSDMPGTALPMVYYVGDGNEMVVAI